jgi:hypothetical protein
MKITSVYIDGFNLYYGCLKDGSYRWLDQSAFCRNILPKNHIHRIRYLIARVHPGIGDSDKLVRQQTYLRALQTLPDLTVHYGHFLRSVVRHPLVNPLSRGPRYAEVIKMEEKGSDVNLATFLFCDGFVNDYEVAVVVSNDSDLALPIEVTRTRLGKDVIIVNPHRSGPSVELRNATNFVRSVRENVSFEASCHPSFPMQQELSQSLRYGSAVSRSKNCDVGKFAIPEENAPASAKPYPVLPRPSEQEPKPS